MKNPFIIGCLLVGLANFFIGFNIITTKYLTFSAIPISILLVLRYFFGCVILIPMMFLSKNKFKFYLSDSRFNHQQNFIYILMALLGGAIFNSIYIFGMRNTTAIATGMTGSTVPLLVVAFSVVFLHQKVKLHHIICALLVALGISFISLSNASQHSIVKLTNSSNIPLLIVFIAMIPEAIFNVLAKMVPHNIAPITSAFIINFINFLVCVPFFVYTVFKFPLYQLTSHEVFLCFLIGLFSGALYYSFYSAGIQKINAQTAGLLTGIVPISTTILAVFLLNEYFGWLTLVGAAFVLFSILIGVKYEPLTSSKIS